MRSGSDISGIVVRLREDKVISDFAILGPSGSGKTSLFHRLVGLRDPVHEVTEDSRLIFASNNCSFTIRDSSINPQQNDLAQTYYNRGTEGFIFVISEELEEDEARRAWLEAIKDKIPLLPYILVINKKTQEPRPDFLAAVQGEFKDIAGITIEQDNCFLCNAQDLKDKGLRQLKAKLAELASVENKAELKKEAQGMLELISTFEADEAETKSAPPSNFKAKYHASVAKVIQSLDLLGEAVWREQTSQAVSGDWNKLVKLHENFSILPKYIITAHQKALCQNVKQMLSSKISAKLHDLTKNFYDYRGHLEEVIKESKATPVRWEPNMVEAKINESGIPLSIKEALQKWVFVNRCCQLLSEETSSESKPDTQKMNDLVAYLKEKPFPTGPSSNQTILDFIEERRSGFIKSFLAAIRRFFGLKPEEIKAARYGFFETKIAPVDGAKLMRSVKALCSPNL